MTVGNLKRSFVLMGIPDDVEIEADTGWECGPVPLGKGFLIDGKLIFVQEGVESLEQKYENMIEEAKKHLTELALKFEEGEKE